MEISLFLAQFWGWLLVIFCAILLIRKKASLEELLKLYKDRGFVWLYGYLALILGLVTVILHNVWAADWRVIITLLGWLSLLKGIGMIVGMISSPELIEKSAPTSIGKPMLILIRISLIIMGLLGVWLIWMSF